MVFLLLFLAAKLKRKILRNDILGRSIIRAHNPRRFPTACNRHFRWSVVRELLGGSNLYLLIWASQDGGGNTKDRFVLQMQEIY